MMKIRVVIAEDEPLPRERLRQLLEMEQDLEVVAECSDGTQALAAIREHRPQLVLLDVQMPGLDGFQVAERLPAGVQPVLVFVTAHDRFVIRAFEASATDYLLKPFDRERFQRMLARVREMVAMRRGSRPWKEILDLVVSLQKPGHSVERFTVRSGSRYILVRPSEVEWVSGAGNYSELHVGKSVHLLRETLNALEQQLPAGKFLRISRSLMVNLDEVTALKPKTHGDFVVVLRSGVELTASRNYRAGIVRLLGREP